MMVNRKPTGRASSMPVGLLWGLLWAILLSIVGALITGKLVDSEVVSERGIGYGAMVTLLIASFVGAKCAVAKVKRLRIQVGLLSGLAYLLTLLATTALFFGGQYQGMGVTGLVVFCGSGSVLFLTPGKKTRGSRHRRKIRL